MKRTYKERLDYEVNRMIGDKSVQSLFFAKAINIQNASSTYDKTFANKKMEFACDVLLHCCFCTQTMCDKCKLHAANKKCIEDINAGIKGPHKNIDIMYSACDTCDIQIKIDKITGRVDVKRIPH